MAMKRTLTSKIYINYRYHIFPKINNIRGSTRLKESLQKATLKQLEKIEETPESIFEKTDWDNLIILDACRYDFYNEIVKDDVEYRISLGSMSKEHLEKTYKERSGLSNIAYISANGHFTKNKLKEIIDTQPFGVLYETILNRWDEEKGTVMPDSVRKDAENAEKLFPEKRKIIHFNQPHIPYIDYEKPQKREEIRETAKNNAHRLAEKGQIPQSRIAEEYKKNIRLAIKEVNKLIPKLSGKTVITADHGELLGENGLYGHPYGGNAKVLRKVPWHQIKSEIELKNNI